ncbi:hypothetical protein M0Q97_12720 [Candidatus Dojkabacteria bacterium]|jgi:hypothetical protein|nr:hypothetical protein [Candidatus Dojkabacteria bacterium]
MEKTNLEPWNIKMCPEENYDIREATEEEEAEERLKSDRYCNWKNADYGQMGFPNYVVNTQCGKEVSDDNINYSFVKHYFKSCPFCGKLINFI